LAAYDHQFFDPFFAKWQKGASEANWLSPFVTTPAPTAFG
jgi:hypothetical protein